MLSEINTYYSLPYQGNPLVATQLSNLIKSTMVRPYGRNECPIVLYIFIII